MQWGTQVCFPHPIHYYQVCMHKTLKVFALPAPYLGRPGAALPSRSRVRVEGRAPRYRGFTDTPARQAVNYRWEVCARSS